jgi:NAD(P)-dependent dehydrogenase (short-subunit alcohol dehydrogenase family)
MIPPRSALPARRGNSMEQLQGKVAVVTGAASGIGLAMAKAFAAEGMKLVMSDIDEARLEPAASELRTGGSEVLTVRTNVAKPEEVEALANATFDHYGAAHVVCNNAGVEVLGQVWEHTLDDWRWVMDVNLWGVIYGQHYFLPRMMEQGGEGHIVNTASMAGLTTSPFMSVYDVTKFGVMALSEATYKDLQVAGSPIGVTVVCPGLIRTEILHADRNRPDDFAETPQYGEATQTFRKNFRAILEGGYGPEEVARQVLEAVKGGQFYCIPAQEQIFQGALARFDDIKERRNPTLRR